MTPAIAMRWLFAGCIVALLGACDQNMTDQPKYEEYESADLFPDGMVNRIPVPGTVARGDGARAATLATRPPMTAALLTRGRERYNIYCLPCHGIVGDGDGMIVQRGYPRPPTLHLDRLRRMPNGGVVGVITHGKGIMYSHAARVPPGDRWAIEAYVRALQFSRHAAVAGLPSDLKARLEARP